MIIRLLPHKELSLLKFNLTAFVYSFKIEGVIRMTLMQSLDSCPISVDSPIHVQ